MSKLQQKQTTALWNNCCASCQSFFCCSCCCCSFAFSCKSSQKLLLVSIQGFSSPMSWVEHFEPFFSSFLASWSFILPMYAALRMLEAWSSKACASMYWTCALASQSAARRMTSLVVWSLIMWAATCPWMRSFAKMYYVQKCWRGAGSEEVVGMLVTRWRRLEAFSWATVLRTIWTVGLSIAGVEVAVVVVEVDDVIVDISDDADWLIDEILWCARRFANFQK